MSKHTEGPWEYRHDEEKDRHYVGYGVCCIVDDVFATKETKDRGQVERKANARLIAAAPELLEVLKFARAYIKPLTTSGGPVLSRIDAAIAKATGESE